MPDHAWELIHAEAQSTLLRAKAIATLHALYLEAVDVDIQLALKKRILSLLNAT